MSFSSNMLRLLPAGLYMGLIFYLSSQPAIGLGGSDKIVHAAAWFLLATFLWFGLRPHLRGWRLWVACWLTASIYGVLDELHQSFVPSRIADPADALADASGAFLALVTLALVQRFFLPPAPTQKPLQ